VLYVRLPNSESRVSNSGKTAYRCNAEFMISFRRLTPENLCEGFHIFTEQSIIGFKSEPGLVDDVVNAKDELKFRGLKVQGLERLDRYFCNPMEGILPDLTDFDKRTHMHSIQRLCEPRSQ